jgi:endonuclease YncB( thermonuclease family)
MGRRRRLRAGRLWLLDHALRPWIIAAAFLTIPAAAHGIPICSGQDRAARKVTCVYDGDTGWKNGRKWRLLDIDAPELGARNGGCSAETAIGKRSRDRLRGLMAAGYEIVDSGKRDRSKRMLVRVRLADGRDAGATLIVERLAQPWPNKGNRWCGF